MANRYVSFSRRVWQILIEVLFGLALLFTTAFTLLHILYQTRVINSLQVISEINPEQIKKLTSLSDLESYLSAYNLDFMVFNDKGEIEARALEKSQEALAKQAFTENAVVETSLESYRTYQVGNQRTLIIRFSLTPEFSNRDWRKLYNFNQIFSYSLLALLLLVIIIPFIRFVCQTRREFHILVDVPQKSTKIHQQSAIDMVRISEIRQAIDSINEMKTRLEKLIDYEKQEKKDLVFQVSALSHDIKTPLTIVKGNASLIRDYQDPQEVVESLKYIEDGVNQIESYLDLMISYSKWINQPDAKHKTNLSQLLADISSQVQGYVGKRIQFEISNQSKRQTFYGSASTITRAVVNILTNAFDYAESKVNLTVSDSGSDLVFQIYNDGPPLDAQSLESMSKLFYTKSTGRSGKHYGLGLYFARLTASLHGGQLTCQNLDKGVLFCLSIQA